MNCKLNYLYEKFPDNPEFAQHLEQIELSIWKTFKDEKFPTFEYEGKRYYSISPKMSKERKKQMKILQSLRDKYNSPNLFLTKRLYPFDYDLITIRMGTIVSSQKELFDVLQKNKPKKPPEEKEAYPSIYEETYEKFLRFNSNTSNPQSSENKNINNQQKNVVYSAIFFNTNELTNKYNQVHPNLYSHHSTIEFKPQTIENLPVGENRNIRIIGRLTTDKVDVLIVDNPLSKNKFPHITLSTAEGVKPFESNSEIEKNQNKIKPLNDIIVGKVGYFDGKNEIVNDEKFDENYNLNKIKSGVEELFDSNPELANIGTAEQYSQYLDTIFPDSQVKDIVYHGSKNKLQENKFDLSKARFEKAIFFFKNIINALKWESENPIKIQKKDLKNIINLNKDLNLEDDSIENNIFYTLAGAQNISDLLNLPNSELILEDFNKIGGAELYLEKSLEEIKKILDKHTSGKTNNVINAILNIRNPKKESNLDYIKLSKEGEKIKDIFREASKNNDGVILENITEYTSSKELAEKNFKTKTVTFNANFGIQTDELYSLNTDTQYAVFEPEQIHILGSKQDVEGFQNFVNQNQIEDNVFINNIASYDENFEKYNKLFEDNSKNYFQLNSFVDIYDNTKKIERLVEEANLELNNRLMNYLKKYNITVKDIKEFENTNKIDAIGVTDILNKIIYIDKKRESLDTLPEEAAHMFTFLLKHTSEMDKMINSIDKWEGYSKVYNDYYSTYEGDIEKIKVEAVGKFIALHLIKQEPTVSKEIKENIFKTLWKFVLQLFEYKNDLQQLNRYAKEIATKVFNNEMLLDINNNSDVALVDFKTALKNDFLATQIHNKMKNYFTLTGSAALSTQGTIYRKSKNLLHDLDYIASEGQLVENKIKELFPNSIKFHNGWRHGDYTTKSYIVPPLGISIINVNRENGNWVEEYDLIDKNLKVVGSYTSKIIDGVRKVRQIGIKALCIDVFDYDKSKSSETFLEFTNWDAIFKAKLEFAREKDIKDWVNFINYKYATLKNDQFLFYQKEENDDNNFEDNVSCFI